MSRLKLFSYVIISYIDPPSDSCADANGRCQRSTHPCGTVIPGKKCHCHQVCCLVSDFIYDVLHFPFGLYIQWYLYIFSSNYCDINIISLYYKLSKNHTIVDMFCSILTLRRISHLRLLLRCDGPWWSWSDLQLPMQSVHISTNVVSSKFAQARCTWYNNMWYKISMTCGRPVSSNNKADRHAIVEILLKVTLHTINQPTFEARLLCEAHSCKTNQQ